jgi:hypothetical protein
MDYSDKIPIDAICEVSSDIQRYMILSQITAYCSW